MLEILKKIKNGVFIGIGISLYTASKGQSIPDAKDTTVKSHNKEYDTNNAYDTSIEFTSPHTRQSSSI
ncbi:MAG: hypothetical protein AAF518_04890 [Spirochaetota bacterium]